MLKENLRSIPFWIFCPLCCHDFSNFMWNEKFWVVTKKISKGKIHYIRQWLRENTYPKTQHLGLWKYLLTSQLWLAMKSSLLLTPEPTNRSIRTARKKIKMALKKKKKKGKWDETKSSNLLPGDTNWASNCKWHTSISLL